jgi:hypothetical protein
MGFPFEVVGVGKKNIIGRSHIEYVHNMDVKTETNDMDGKISKNQAVLKKTTLKTDFGCESYALTFTNKFLYEVTHLYKKK